MTPDIAVIVPTHNRAKFLAAALDSVFAQTFLGRAEVVIVDDGSTDDTAAVVAPYLDRTGRVTVRYHRIEKAGVCAARNLAVAETSAPLVAFLDSDDVWESEKLGRQVASLADPGVGVSHTDFRYIDPAGHFTDAGPQRPDNPCAGRCLTELLAEDRVIFSSVLMRRSVIAAVAAAEPHGLPFDPRWTNGQDYDLLLRAALLTSFAYEPAPLTRYRIHDAQNAMGNLKRVFGFHCRVQVDFARRHGLPANAGIDAAREFLLARAESLYWQRRLDTTRDLCDLADELGLADGRFAALRRMAGRPGWVLKTKDVYDAARRVVRRR